jgi:Asp-tRNA(Asn)/Glu-tRNA(Gln) amidotransferase A subunit family amidase
MALTELWCHMTRETEDVGGADVDEYARRLGFDPDTVDEEAVLDAVAAQDDIVSALDDLPAPTVPDRDHWAPDGDDDPNAAFLRRVDLKRTADGPLDGLDVGVKDNIAVGGVPMTCGSPLLEEHVPARDATVVERLLDAGARIVGKTNMDEFALGGGAASMRFRLAQNPNRRGYQPGGSSSGSGVAVAEGSVDAALGTDTGGSVRFPASFCGVVGVKPTRGLVSHDGFVQFSKTVDTVGVLAADVDVAARTLAAIAGQDDRDGTTRGARTDDYAAVATADVDPGELTVGVPEELFGLAAGPDETVSAALDTLADAGADVRPVSIPDFEYAVPAWIGVAMTEMAAYVRERLVHFWQVSDPLASLADAFAAEATDRTETLGDPVVQTAMYGQHLSETYDNRYYIRGQAGRRRVTAGVDEALSGVDVLAGPTTPMLPPEWGEGYLDDAGLFDAMRNTAPFNLTGHPAVSVPCGTRDGLPVGLQFVAPHFEERTALRAAATWDALAGD